MWVPFSLVLPASALSQAFFQTLPKFSNYEHNERCGHWWLRKHLKKLGIADTVHCKCVFKGKFLHTVYRLANVWRLCNNSFGLKAPFFGRKMLNYSGLPSRHDCHHTKHRTKTTKDQIFKNLPSIIVTRIPCSHFPYTINHHKSFYYFMPLWTWIKVKVINN